MQQHEMVDFSNLVTSVYGFYNQSASPFDIEVWWQAFKQFDFDAVNDAFNRHVMNPDNGQYRPSPADLVRLLQGSSQDGALVAWAKVDKAVRSAGTYRSVAFDDPIIHAVIMDMGGWVEFGNKSEKEWPFVAKEFENRYRGYRMRDLPEYPRWLVGISESSNSQLGMRVEPPMMIGNTTRAKLVMQGGSSTLRLGFTQASEMDIEDVLLAEGPMRLSA